MSGEMQLYWYCGTCRRYIPDGLSHECKSRPTRKELKARIRELEQELDAAEPAIRTAINTRVRDLSDHINQIARENTQLKADIEKYRVMFNEAQAAGYTFTMEKK